MERVVIDTSVWIEFFRNAPFTLEDQIKTLLLGNRPVMCGLVEMELFSGADESEKNMIKAKFSEMDYLEMNRDDYAKASSLYQTMRARGKILQRIDLLIAAFCVQRGLLLMTLDKDFEGIPGLERLRPNLP